MRPIFGPSDENDDPFPARRLPAATATGGTKRSPLNKQPLANKSNNVRSRLYEPKASAVQARQTLTTAQSKQALVAAGIGSKPTAAGGIGPKKPVGQRNITAKGPTAAAKETFQAAIVEAPKPLTIEERLTAIEAAVRGALIKSDVDLSALVADDSQMAFPTALLDEAAAYCDRTDSYIDLLGFYREQLDLAGKMTERLAAVRQTRDAHLEALHDATRFLSMNLWPFRRSMNAKKMEIVAAFERAKEEEAERLRANPPPLKRPVEMRDVEVQVLPESLIYYSPTAGILRSSAAQKIMMPPSPLLLSTTTCHQQQYSHMTPTSSSRRFGTERLGVKSSATTMRVAAGGSEMTAAEVSFINCEESIQQLYNSAGRPSMTAGCGKSPGARRLKFEEFTAPAPPTASWSLASRINNVESTPLTSGGHLARISEVSESPTRLMLFNDTTLRSTTSNLFDISATIRRGQTVTMPPTPTLQSSSYNFKRAPPN